MELRCDRTGGSRLLLSAVFAAALRHCGSVAETPVAESRQTSPATPSDFSDCANSRGRSHPVGQKQPNPWGLLDMSGNVKEFRLDFCAPDAYLRPSEGAAANSSGPADGDEHVLRGGSCASRPAALRCAARDRTRLWDWLKTDPQSPKSVWWHSDNNEVEFRVVRPYEPGDSESNPGASRPSSKESRR